jgi:hypothetical protein
MMTFKLIISFAVAVGVAGCELTPFCDIPDYQDKCIVGDSSTGEDSGESGDGDGDGDGEPGFTCGDSTVDVDEECDTNELGGATCVGLGFVGGEIGCRDDCTLDMSGCYNQVCGNSMIEGMEECDGPNIGGANCIDLGEGPGTPSCTVDCTLDLSSCGIPGEGEACDWGDCPDNLYCEDDVCYDGSLGDPCSVNEDCLSGVCSDFFTGTCQ